ncbi:hypothetical protein SCB71_14435 [Herbiconiux sp. KACC 21604]|uniref:hypothetical protein n=1 Tax=unclassified Herbiconiux TaxID=2618217 RepID=UPI001490A80B|nr:hypothetical protein [Herbiconiux sp. SALV-R1]QJU54340.1 hypothetical protein HL652_12375 [Herbiconiux sp. SALV-R1]WPO85410.1 hypothetical protein SCB71_14435 [Herbiconiux sp. KACC 21604]
MSKLNTHVTVHDENGVAHTFTPDDTVPGWAETAITNPNVWAEKPSKAASSGKTKSKGKEKSEPKQEPAQEPTGSEDGELVVPPMVGAGSSADAWKAYAVAAVAKAGQNIEFPEDAKRGDIIAALDEAGIQTKAKE